MRKFYFLLFFFSFLFFGKLFSQAQLVINNGGYVVLNGGTSGSPIYLVVENSNVTSGVADGIKRITSGHIISEGEFNKVQWNTRTSVGLFEFPLGRSSTYLPFNFDKTTAGTESAVGKVTASTWFTSANATGPNAIPGADLFCVGNSEANVLDRYWQIDVTGYSANPSANVRFYYDQANDLDGIAESLVQAQRWNSALTDACKWEPPVGTVDETFNYVGISGISSFSPWTLVNRSSPLPIELLSFSGECLENKIELEWETASETNNDYFTVERSLDGEAFAAIEKINGAGNSGNYQQYKFTDSHFTFPSSGLLQYRLKQTDFDGSFSYSGVIALQNCEEEGNDNVTIFIGNNKEFILNVNASREKKFDLYFYDNLGRKIHSEIINVSKGFNTKILQPKKFTTAVYHVLLMNKEEVIAKKVFLK